MVASGSWAEFELMLCLVCLISRNAGEDVSCLIGGGALVKL